MNKINNDKINNIKGKIIFKLPPLNNYSSRKKWEEACWQKILKSQNIVDFLITSYEKHNLVMRAAAISDINLGKKCKEIANELWLSPQTISNIKRVRNGDSYLSYRETGKTERKKKEYSPNRFSEKPKKFRGRPQRTKYGTIYMPL